VSRRRPAAVGGFSTWVYGRNNRDGGSGRIATEGLGMSRKGKRPHDQEETCCFRTIGTWLGMRILFQV